MVFLVMGACNLPNDSHDSWENAKKGGLKVGVVENPPFCYTGRGGLTGTEVKLLREFARKEHLQLGFVTGSESNLVERLEHYELHVLIGGFKKNTVWKKKAGLTTTYLDERVMLIPRGENRLLRNLETYLLKKYDGLPEHL